MQTAKVIDFIVQWLTQYCEASGLNGFVVGVSGGIDSAVTSSLCAQTGKQVYVLNMPICQASDQVSRADQHIGWLKQHFKQVKGVTVDLTEMFQNVLQATTPTAITQGFPLGPGHYRLLVAGTGNKVEDFGVGFYTKYGDGGVDIAPIADLMKSEVYAVGKAMGVGASILTAQPTDGLWNDDRTDESQIGASYTELEWAMQHEAESTGKSTLTDRQKEVLQIYRRFNRANAHKMEPIPIAKIPDHLR